MSEIFAEATVTLNPDLTGFATKLQAQLKEVIGGIETGSRPPKIRVAPALTKNFIGELRRLANTAIEQAQAGVKPLRVSVALGPLPTGQLREIQQASRVLGRGAFGGVVETTRELTSANEQFIPTQQRVNALFAQGAADLTAFTRVEDAAGKARRRRQGAGSTQTGQGAAKSIAEARAATNLLNRATTELTASENASLTTEQRLSLLRSAQRGFVLAEAEALGKLSTATDRATRTELQRIATTSGAQAANLANELERQASAQAALQAQARASAAALRANSNEAGRVARTQAQLRRGALATSLSFLGIRGATLAASASFLAGAAAIAVFAKALDSATRFTDQLNVFRATTSATRTEVEAVAQAARALGADLSLPGVTAGDAAEAMTELAKAGLDVQNSIAGARGVLQLATAAAIENAQAVELVANALNAFQLQGEDAVRVADTFANAANAAQGSIVDIGIAFQQSAAAGRQVGLSFEDTTEFLTVLARAGLRGSDAGTSLRTALIRLINPSKEAAAQLKSLGVQIRDAAGNVRPDVFIQITEATRNLTKAERDRVIALVGGQDAFRAISILGRQSIEDFIRLRRELREQGTAGELAAARMQGLRGALEGLGNSLSTIGVRIGQSVTPSLQGVVEGVSGVTVALASSDTAAGAFGGSVEFLQASLTGLGATLRVLATAFGPVIGGAAGLANAVGVANILAAVAAYKLIPALLGRITAAYAAASLSAGRFAAVNARAASIFGVSRLRVAVTQLTRSFNLWGIAIGLVAAGLFFLITRETSLERVTRKLAESTDAVVDAQQRLNAAREQSSTAGLSISAARLGVVTAQDAAAAAQAKVSAAPAGTFARTRAELELAVALDNVKIAQRDLNKAVQEANDSREVTLNAIKQERQARRDQIANLRDLADAERRSQPPAINRLTLSQGPLTPGRRAELEQRREVEAAKGFREEIQKRIQALREEGSIESLNQAKRLQLLKQVSTALGTIPSNKVIALTLNATGLNDALRRVVAQLAGVGREGQVAFLRAFATGASPQVAAAINALIRDITSQSSGPAREGGHKTGFEFGQGMASGITDAGAAIGAAVGSVIARAQGRLQGLQRQGTRLEIAGASPEARLANVRAQEAEANRVLAELERNGAAEDSINKQLQVINGIVQQRRGIEAEIAANQKDSADKAKDAADAADEANLSRLERVRTRAQERITDAQATETLADDLRQNIIFRNLIRKQINRIRDLIKDRKEQADAIRALQAIERDVNREIKDLQKQRRDQIAERIAESIQLDIEFGQITENARLEINARRREIQRLRKLQADTKKGTIEYRRLRNLIAEQQRAIEELTAQQKDKNNAANEMGFAFLQAQSGFVANLLGNLIPGGATGGLVGGQGGNFGGNIGAFGPTTVGGGGGTVSGGGGGGLISGPFIPGQHGGPSEPSPVGGRVGVDLAKATGAKTAAGGPTRGGQATELHLLREIIHILRDIRRGSTHPEARNRRARDANVMEISEHK